jgi:hypothetical protein
MPRTPAKNLVLKTIREKPGDWYCRLNEEDQLYVDDVVDALRNNAGASVFCVSHSLVKELNITTQPETVSKTLRNMIHASKSI